MILVLTTSHRKSSEFGTSTKGMHDDPILEFVKQLIVELAERLIVRFVSWVYHRWRHRRCVPPPAGKPYHTQSLPLLDIYGVWM